MAVRGRDQAQRPRRGARTPHGARRRRTAEEAHREILAAAERRLIRGGPEAVRLEEIAADVGVSRPAVLYHFGSRDGLLRALVRHAMDNMQQDLIRVLGSRPTGEPLAGRSERTFEMFERISEVFARRGYARILAALILAGKNLKRTAAGTGAAFAQVVHALRSQRRAARGRSMTDLEDSLWGLTLIFVTLFGDALVGPHVRLAFGLPDDAESARRFRRWFAQVVEAYEPPARQSPVAGGRVARQDPRS